MPIRGLAIETSSRRGEVAAILEGQPVATEAFASGLRHASGLIGMLQRVMDAAGWPEGSISSVDELYLSIGPGSFTGLRVAVALAKGIWLARTTAGLPDLRIVAVPTLDGIVRNLPGQPGDEAAVILDAKRGQVFTASYRWTSACSHWELARPARLDTLAHLLADAAARGVRLHLTGEGLAYHPVPAGAEAVAAEEALWWPRAATVGQLGHALARQGIFADVPTLEPFYVRLPEAEEKWAAQQPPKP